MKLNPDLVFRQEFDGTGILFNPENGNIFYLTQTSAFICSCLQQDMERDAILAGMREHITGIPENVEGDLDDFLAQLREKGCLMTGNAEK